MKLAALIIAVIAFLARKVPYFRHAAAFFRTAAISSYLGVIWSYFSGHGSTHGHGLMAFGSMLFFVAHFTHQVVMALETAISLKEHIEDWRNPEERSALIRTWIFLGVLLAHLALIFCL